MAYRAWFVSCICQFWATLGRRIAFALLLVRVTLGDGTGAAARLKVPWRGGGVSLLTSSGWLDSLKCFQLSSSSAGGEMTCHHLSRSAMTYSPGEELKCCFLVGNSYSSPQKKKEGQISNQLTAASLYRKAMLLDAVISSEKQLVGVFLLFPGRVSIMTPKRGVDSGSQSLPSFEFVTYTPLLDPYYNGAEHWPKPKH